MTKMPLQKYPSDYDYEALTNLNGDALEGKRLG